MSRPLGPDRLAAIERQLATLTRLAPRLATELPSEEWVEVMQLLHASAVVLAQGPAAPEPELDRILDAWESLSDRVLKRLV
jgi:hypothetical protein